MIEMHSRVARRIQHPWRATALVVAVVIGGLVIAFASVVPFSSETARRKSSRCYQHDSMQKWSWLSFDFECSRSFTRKALAWRFVIEAGVTCRR